MTISAEDYGVTRFLLTTSEQGRLVAWAKTANISNWIESRRNHHGSRTWFITVYEADREKFLEILKGIDNAVTVEEVVVTSDSETYKMLVGTPGEGWAAV